MPATLPNPPIRTSVTSESTYPTSGGDMDIYPIGSSPQLSYPMTFVDCVKFLEQCAAAPEEEQIPALRALARTLQQATRGQGRRTGSTQIRTQFTPEQIRRIEALCGDTPLSIWVRCRIIEVMDGKVELSKQPLARSTEPSRRVTFWIRDDHLSRLDQLRGGLKRNAWVQETCIRSILP